MAAMGSACKSTTAAHELQAWRFIALCLTVGPVIGLVALIGIGWVGNPKPIPFSFPGLEIWLLAYLGGGIYAFWSAVLFVFIGARLGYTNYFSVIVSATIPPFVFHGWSLVGDLVHPDRTQLFSWRVLGEWSAVCVIAMTVCWLAARALRIIR